MSTESKENDSSRKNEGGKNKETIYCTFCPSRILNAGNGNYVHVEFPLPNMRRKEEGTDDAQETVTDYWLVDDMYTFENVGVSNTVDNVKYLTCADCERGPIGWHDLATKKSYVALSRVKYN